MKPRKSILDRSFRYVPSHKTDIKKRFEEMKRETQPSATITQLPKVKR